MALKTLKVDDNEIIGNDSNKTNKIIVNLSKNLMYVSNIRAIGKPLFLTLNAKKNFNYLKQIFVKTPIF